MGSNRRFAGLQSCAPCCAHGPLGLSKLQLEADALLHTKRLCLAQLMLPRRAVHVDR